MEEGRTCVGWGGGGGAGVNSNGMGEVCTDFYL